ncbi:MAG: IPTL-CTERM sorting domain-containing protein, partial [Proteobacteria bacterium]|nr:IPTL-CTERM sorting domain-containing protein [Pseudomonadota bacterium]
YTITLVEKVPGVGPGDWLLRANGIAASDPIPTTSEWGMIAMALALLGAGTLLVRRRTVIHD